MGKALKLPSYLAVIKAEKAHFAVFWDVNHLKPGVDKKPTKLSLVTSGLDYSIDKIHRLKHTLGFVTTFILYVKMHKITK